MPSPLTSAASLASCAGSLLTEAIAVTHSAAPFASVATTTLAALPAARLTKTAVSRCS